MLSFSVKPIFQRRSDQDVGMYVASWATWDKTRSLLQTSLKGSFDFDVDLNEAIDSNKLNLRCPQLIDSVWFSVYEVTLFAGESDSPPTNNALLTYNPGTSDELDYRLFYQTHLCDVNIKLEDIIGELSRPGRSRKAQFKRAIMDKKLADHLLSQRDSVRDTDFTNRGTLEITVTLDEQANLSDLYDTIKSHTGKSRRVFSSFKYNDVTAPMNDAYMKRMEEDMVEYVKAFMKVFPLSTDALRNKSEASLSYKYPFELNYRMTASCYTLLTNHLPYFKTDYGKLPIMCYYLHCTRPTQVNKKHEAFISKLASIVLERYDITEEAFIATLDRWFKTTSPISDKQKFLTMIEVYNEIITELANNLKYRPDFRLKVRKSGIEDKYREGSSDTRKSQQQQQRSSKSKEETIYTESVDWDLILNFSGCDDCEGQDRLTSELVHIIECGLVSKDNKRSDISSYPILDAVYNKGLNGRKVVYDWKNPLVRCLQTVALHYVNMSTLIAAGMAEGGDFHQTELVLRDRRPVVTNGYRLGTKEDTQGDYGCHMFSLAVPWTKVTDYLERAIEVENKGRTFREQEARNTLSLVESLSSSIRRKNYDRYLPVMCVESTARVRPLLISKTYEYGRASRGLDNAVVERELEDRYFDYKINTIDKDISCAVEEEACNVYRVSSLTWLPGEEKERHVSTFYRQCAYSFSRKLHELDRNLGVLAWVNTHSNLWGISLTEIMMDTDQSPGLVCVHHRIDPRLKKSLWQHMANLEDILPPVTVCNTDILPTSTKIAFADWLKDVHRRFKLDESVLEMATSMFLIAKPSNGGHQNGYESRLSDTKSFYVCDDYLSQRAFEGLVRCLARMIQDKEFKFIDVFEQKLYPVFGKKETVIVLSK